MNLNNPNTPLQRYGIAELYGRDISALPTEDLRRLAGASHFDMDCPFRGLKCKKKGGVCSLRAYQKSGNEASPTEGPLVTVCPERFKESGKVNRFIGEELLGTTAPTQVAEVDFLETPGREPEDKGDAVGRIDNILINEAALPMHWCAVEMQAVYFSGPAMGTQFAGLREWQGPGLPWPDKVRRPDYRSSGPKRLMPQLQTKVPRLRRWGKKMVVVTDLSFFEHMGTMQEVPELSNCDIVWVVVDYSPHANGFTLELHSVHRITLERAIDGLIAGEPVSLGEFERRITGKLASRSSNQDRD